MKLKNLLSNKNVVTFLGAILIVIVLYVAYRYAVNKAIHPIRIPYAVVTIGPRTEITSDMIDYLEKDNLLIQKVRERQRNFGPRSKDRS